MDSECIPTIHNIWQTSQHRNQVFVGVVWQIDISTNSGIRNALEAIQIHGTVSVSIILFVFFS
jgi:hypothetical protein